MSDTTFIWGDRTWHQIQGEVSEPFFQSKHHTSSVKFKKSVTSCGLKILQGSPTTSDPKSATLKGAVCANCSAPAGANVAPAAVADKPLKSAKK